MHTRGTMQLYVLAGGRSSRFGANKALAPVDGVPMVRSVIDALAGEPTATLVANHPDNYAHLGYRVITDRPAEMGPIGGLSAALYDRLSLHGPGWIVLASCDLVCPQREWLEQLHDAADSCNDASAIAFQGAHWEPMLALYHTALMPVVSEQINNNRGSMQALLDRAQATAIALPDGLATLPQANTPEQLHDALQQRGVA